MPFDSKTWSIGVEAGTVQDTTQPEYLVRLHRPSRLSWSITRWTPVLHDGSLSFIPQSDTRKIRSAGANILVIEALRAKWHEENKITA